MQMNFLKIFAPFGVMLMGLLLSSCGDQDGSNSPAPLLISTDNAAGIKSDFNPNGAPFDDFLVIMQAMNEPSFDVTLIGALFNNYMTDATYLVSRFQVEHQGLPSTGIPTSADKARADNMVYMGASGPLRNMYGASGEDNPNPTKSIEFLTRNDEGAPFEFSKISTRICSNGAVEAMAVQLRAMSDPGTATLLAIGPLTDVACLIEAHPELIAKIKEIVYLGGRYAGSYDANIYKDAVDALRKGRDDPNTINYLIEMLDCPTTKEQKGARPLPPECPEVPNEEEKRYFQPLPDSNTNSDFPAAHAVLASGVPVTVVVGPLAQQVKIDYDKLGEDHKIDGDVTLLTKFLRAGAKKRGGQRDVIAWDSTAFNYLISPDQYSCETSHWQFVACTSIPKSGKPVDENDVCLTHRESDPGGWTANEYYQLWIGDLKNIPTAVSRLEPPAAQKLENGPGVSGPSNNTVRVCHNFVDGGANIIAERITKYSF